MIRQFLPRLPELLLLASHIELAQTLLDDISSDAIGPVVRSKPYGAHRNFLTVTVIPNMSFEPKHKVELDPPKDDPISPDYLAKCDGKHFPEQAQVSNTNRSIGTNQDYPTYVAIKVLLAEQLTSTSLTVLFREQSLT